MKGEFIGENGTNYTSEGKLGQGGQGYVYKVVDNNGNNYAIKYYKKRIGTSSQRGIIKSLLSNEPSVADKRVSFIWPLDMVHLKGNSSFGYVMKLYDAKQYIHYNNVLGGYVKQPSLESLSLASYLVCVGLEAVHRNGYAYCDINLGNIQFDFKNNKIIISDNDNVVINNADVNILGVPEFMAPEVALGKSKPNALSDLYSLAILLYELWTGEHPMEGKRTVSIRSWDLVSKDKYYHKEPIFVHDPANDANSIKNIEIYKRSLKRWDYYLPEKTKRGFIKTFTQGVVQPNIRTNTGNWKNIFLEMYCNVLTCKCGAKNIFDADNNNQHCFRCKRKIPISLYLSVTKSGETMKIGVRDKVKIYRFFVEDMNDERAFEVIGVVEPHPKSAGAYIVRNQTDQTWMYKVSDNQYSIEPGKARALVPNAELYIGNGAPIKAILL